MSLNSFHAPMEPLANEKLFLKITDVVLEFCLIQTNHTRPVQFRERGLLWETRVKGGNKDEEGKRSNDQEEAVFYFGCDVTTHR